MIYIWSSITLLYTGNWSGLPAREREVTLGAGLLADWPPRSVMATSPRTRVLPAQHKGHELSLDTALTLTLSDYFSTESPPSGVGFIIYSKAVICDSVGSLQ